MRLATPTRHWKTLGAIAFAAITATLTSAPRQAAAQCQVLKWTLNNPSPAASDSFGRAVAISESYVVVGAYWDDTGGTNAGIAYVYDADTGGFVRTLTSPVPAGDDYFGYSVAIWGNKVLIGAYQDDTGANNAGSAYLFDAATGSLLREFNDPNPVAFNQFGFSVAIEGNYALIGANGDDTGATEAGRAYLFDATTGSLLQTFANPTPAASDFFGEQVAISGNNALVGAPFDNTGATDAGSVYLFSTVTGSLLRTINNPTPAASDQFGQSIGISGLNVLVGAFQDDTAATDAGRAYLFSAATGSLLRTLAHPSPAGSDRFGYAVSISGNNILIGVKDTDVGAGNTGSSLLFDAVTGSPMREFYNPTPAFGDDFGAAVAISGNRFIVGDNLDDTGASDTGAAYMYACPPPECAPDILLQTVANPSPALTDNFGNSVAVDGALMIVGAYSDDPGGTLDAGSAYVLNAATGALVTTLNNPSPQVGDYFGTSVAISGNLAVVGEPYEQPAGEAYVFNATTGSVVSTLVNPAPNSQDEFGHAVAISGSLAVVTAYTDDPGGTTDAGTAYVFNATTGALVSTLNNPSPNANDKFGNSVSISGNLVIIGVEADDPNAVSAAGAAYVFNASTGALITTLLSPDPSSNDAFGSSVAISGSLAVVGAKSDELGLLNEGTAYVFEAASGALITALRSPAPEGGANFGISVGISGGLAVVGAHFDTVSGVSQAGAAYIFDVMSGDPLATLDNPAPAVSDLYGFSAGISGQLAVVGAYYDNPGGTTDAGSVYTFTCDVDCIPNSPGMSIENPTPVMADQFGYSVAADGDLVVIGEHAYDSAATDQGIAHVYNASTGASVATLNNPSPSNTDQFGDAVAISGNMVVVGAPLIDAGATNSGRAFVFNATTGASIATLNNPSPASLDERFGHSVAIDGNLAVVGARNNDTGATDAGQAYVFNASTGALIATLANPAPGLNEYFGMSVAIDGGRAVVGAHYDDPGAAADAGSAYVFDAVSGALLVTLIDPDRNADDKFGRAVAISGNIVIVGAEEDDGSATEAGEAYVFDATTGALIATLPNPAPEADDFFGQAVSIHGNLALVGAPGDTGSFPDHGRAFLFNATTGALLATLNNPGASAGAEFGYSVALLDNKAYLGAYLHDVAATNTGSVHVFECPAATPTPTVTPSATPSRTPTFTPTATATPTPSPSVSPTASPTLTPSPTPCVPNTLLRSIPNPAAAANDGFGRYVAVSGNMILVGVPADDPGAVSNAGTAYVLDATTGALITTLNNPAPTTDDLFGSPVAIYGNLAVVGAHMDDAGATDGGTAYVFNATTGALVTTLNNPAPAASDAFGVSVAISGNVVVVGAYQDDAAASDAGTAYVFNATTGALITTLTNPSPTVNDQFGWSVSISGNVAVVGARYDDAGAVESGTAYVFNATTGAHTATLNNPAPGADDEFGYSTAIYGNLAVVGAFRDDTGATNAGTAYVFNATTGANTATLNNPAPTADDEFGVAVAIFGSVAVVGAFQDDSGTTDAGTAYVFDAATGTLTATLNNPAPTTADEYGVSVAISGNTIAVGATNDDAGASNAGSAYTFNCAAPTPSPTPTVTPTASLTPTVSPTPGFANLTTSALPGGLILSGQGKGVFEMRLFHQGQVGENDIELASLRLGFEDEFAAPLTQIQVSDIIASVRLYLDDGDALFNPLTDILVSSVIAPAPPGGILDFTLPDGAANLRVSVGATKRYFLEARATGNAGTQNPNRFKIRHIRSGSVVEDAVTDAPMGLLANTSILSNLFIAGSPTGSITSPLTGDCRKGNRVLLRAEISPPAGFPAVRDITFEYSPAGFGLWNPIPGATIHPNPDDDNPFFVHWNVNALPEGDYDIRATVTDTNNVAEPSPSIVTITVSSSCGINEFENGAQEVQVDTPVTMGLVNEIRSGNGDLDRAARVTLPAGLLTANTQASLIARDPASLAGALGPYDNAGTFFDLNFAGGLPPGGSGLLDGSKGLITEQTRIVITYDDRDFDGLVDGTTIRETDLWVGWRDNAVGGNLTALPQGACTLDLAANFITCDIPVRSTSTYALMGLPATGAETWAEYE